MHSVGVRPVLIVATLLFAQGAACADGTPGQRDLTCPSNFISRLEALALLQTLNADLLSHDSATLTLDRWCAVHRLASPAKIVAERVRGVEKELTMAERELLRVSAGEPVQYRRVRLLCGKYVLSEADNWYVPARLTRDINQQLETSDVAFGRAVRPLHPQRRTLSSKLLWAPLPDGWEMNGAPASDSGPSTSLRIPWQILEHRAVLTLPDGTPISAVVETYTREVLAFPPPRMRGCADSSEEGEIRISWRGLNWMTTKGTHESD